jgi:hypothetical protein
MTCHVKDKKNTEQVLRPAEQVGNKSLAAAGRRKCEWPFEAGL